MNLMETVAAAAWASSAFRAAAPGGISADELPEQATLPAATYQEIVTTGDPTFDGPGLQRLRVQFDCFAATRAQAVAARTALIRALEGAGPFTSDEARIQGVKLLNGGASAFANESRRFRAMSEFYVFYVLS